MSDANTPGGEPNLLAAAGTPSPAPAPAAGPTSAAPPTTESGFFAASAAAASYCDACGARMASGARFCEACGRDTLGPDHMLEQQMVARLRKARGWILAVGILYILNGLWMWYQLRPVLFLPIAKGLLATVGALALIQFGLWWWARREPFAAAVVALGLFVSLQVVQLVIDPSSIYKGIIVKVLFIVALVQAVSSGLQVRKLRAQAARVPVTG